jgi:hypothetical protein
MKPLHRSRGSASLAAWSLIALLGPACTPAGSEGNPPANTGGNGGSGSKTGGSSGGSGGSGGNSTQSGGTGGGSPGSGGAQAGGSGGGGAGGAGGEASGGAGGNGAVDATADSSNGSDASTPPSQGLGPWMGTDNVPPSANPPGGLKPEQVPMFISMGFDDGNLPDGVSWVATELAKLKNPAGKGQAATYDGTPVRVTFYDTSNYGSMGSAAPWKAAYMLGHELGNHTVSHSPGGRTWSEAMWTTEIKGCIDYHTGAAIAQKKEDIWGFRSPFLHYNGATMAVVKKLGFWYDCSIEEGVQPNQDGSNYLWPYTLDSGSPGNAAHPNPEVVKPTTWPKGLWEMPAYKVVLPPDSEAAKYGVPVGLRAKMKANQPNGIGINEGKITGLDYNLWANVAEGAYAFNKAEFVATLKYTLDQRLKGNRAPFLMGMHTYYYSSTYNMAPNANFTDRRAAVLEFLNWAVSTYPDVRVVTTKAVLDWIRNPVPLKQ